MDSKTRDRCRALLLGTTCGEAESTTGNRDGVLDLRFDRASLQVLCEWAVSGEPHLNVEDTLHSMVGVAVASVSVHPTSGMLTIGFANNAWLRATPDSDEYESWTITSQGESIGAGPGKSGFHFRTGHSTNE